MSKGLKNIKAWGCAILLLFFPVTTWAAVDYTCTTNADGTLTINDYTGTGGDEEIPSVIEGKTVSAIGSCVFTPSDNLTGVTLPNSITNIGVSAFIECASLTNVVIPDNVIQIDDGAFYGCAGLTRIAIPDNVARLGGLVFFGCTGLTNIAIPAGVAQIGAGAFAGCENMAAIEVAASNAMYGSMAGVLYNKDQTTLVQCPAGKVGGFSVDSSVTTIGELAFSGCWRLSDIEMPEGVLRIELRAFVGCDGLTNAAIPGSVTQIVGRAYTGCGRLMEIAVDETNAIYRSIDGMLFDKAGHTLLQYPGGRYETCEIPNGTTDIGEAAFAFSSNLTQVVIAASVTNIGDYAFDRCLSLTNAVIGDGVRHIGDCAFGLCWHMTDVAFGTGVRSIGLGTFSGCIKLENLVIPDGVTDLGFWAFSSCYALTNLALPDSVTNIGAYAFQHCGLMQVEIGSGLVRMESALFQGCTNLTRITIPSNISAMVSSVFAECIKLESVYFCGKPPMVDEEDVFYDSTPTVYYLPGVSGWPPVPDLWAGRPTALWLPEAVDDGSLGVQGGQFGFNVDWAKGKTVVVEGCTNLADPVWVPIQTNMLAEGQAYFGDSGWTNHVGRFYRLREP